ncbi:MAG: lysophospholipid acyltransferase family protein [Myxococcota bacterium]
MKSAHPESDREAELAERELSHETRPLDHLVSAALWATGLSWLIPSLGLSTLLFRIVPSHRIDWVSKTYCRVQIALTTARWRAVVHPNIDPDKSYIFCQNHTNHFDHVVMYNATSHFKQGIELESHFQYPFYGWFMKARGTIPVPANRSERYAQVKKGIQSEIEQGRSVLAFPEGTRTRDGRVAPFRTGIFRAARELGVPIIPTAVTGMFDLMRKGSYRIRPLQELVVYCEEPIETKGIPEHSLPELVSEVHRIVADRVDAYFESKRLRTTASEASLRKE